MAIRTEQIYFVKKLLEMGAEDTTLTIDTRSLAVRYPNLSLISNYIIYFQRKTLSILKMSALSGNSDIITTFLAHKNVFVCKSTFNDSNNQQISPDIEEFFQAIVEHNAEVVSEKLTQYPFLKWVRNDQFKNPFQLACQDNWAEGMALLYNDLSDVKIVNVGLTIIQSVANNKPTPEFISFLRNYLDAKFPTTVPYANPQDRIDYVNNLQQWCFDEGSRHKAQALLTFGHECALLTRAKSLQVKLDSNKTNQPANHAYRAFYASQLAELLLNKKIAAEYGLDETDFTLLLADGSTITPISHESARAALHYAAIALAGDFNKHRILFYRAYYSVSGKESTFGCSVDAKNMFPDLPGMLEQFALQSLRLEKSPLVEDSSQNEQKTSASYKL